MAETYRNMATRNNYSWDDINNGDIEGFDFPQLNINENGQRSDTFTLMLKKHENSRKNLVVMRNSHVIKVLIENKQAKGKYSIEKLICNIFSREMSTKVKM